MTQNQCQLRLWGVPDQGCERIVELQEGCQGICIESLGNVTVKFPSGSMR